MQLLMVIRRSGHWHYINPTKMSNKFKHFVGCCRRIVWVFDHFVGLALKRLSFNLTFTKTCDTFTYLEWTFLKYFFFIIQFSSRFSLEKNSLAKSTIHNELLAVTFPSYRYLTSLRDYEKVVTTRTCVRNVAKYREVSFTIYINFCDNTFWYWNNYHN